MHATCTDWRLVDQAQVDALAEATGDRQWIHVDTERAKGRRDPRTRGGGKPCYLARFSF